MSIDRCTMALISVGASVAANCHPCLEFHSAKAREAGVSDEEILAAAEVGRAVRAGAAKSMDQLIAIVSGHVAAKSDSNCGCGCNG